MHQGSMKLLSKPRSITSPPSQAYQENDKSGDQDFLNHFKNEHIKQQSIQKRQVENLNRNNLIKSVGNKKRIQSNFMIPNSKRFESRRISKLDGSYDTQTMIKSVDGDFSTVLSKGQINMKTDRDESS